MIILYINCCGTSQQLTWSHFVKLVAIDDPLKRDFYAELCRLERWNVRGLRQKIDSMLFERTAISKQTELAPRKLLENKLRSAIEAAREKYSRLQLLKEEDEELSTV